MKIIATVLFSLILILQGEMAAAVAAPVVIYQDGVILNTAPFVSVAASPVTITLPGAANSRVCVRGIVIFATGATGNVTLTIQDGATVVIDLGVAVLSTLSVPTTYSGTPIMCGSVGNNVVINVGAGAASEVTHTSIVADRN